ncbi:GMC oxidoreductase [Streptomyces sp. NPDC014724]|uniref:GMC oxidoreductase n=1 Tax=unclassified Streptomyces TaxID=2593676 RepID=UPI0036F589E4
MPPTAAFLSKGPPTCVGGLLFVGPELRVHGIEGLRIIDASVFPSVPSAHTVATVYVVTEHAADVLHTRP